jgi:serpin B
VIIPKQPASPAAAVTATDQLALALLPRLGGSGNATFSPYSIEAALAMVDQGAAGTTETQIDHVLAAKDPAELAAANHALRTALIKAAGSAQLDTANSLWLQSGFAVKRAFSRTLADDFGVAPQIEDFASDPDGARTQINGWVADHTAQLIPDLFPPGTITAQTLLVLADAIYLKAKWATPFDASQTAPQEFYPASGPAVETPFMSFAQGGAPIPYASAPGYRAVELPYRDSSLSMLAVMPTPGTLPHFERSLTPAGLQRIAASLHGTTVSLSMPKLSLKFETSLNGVLGALGMPSAFDNAADFSNIAERPALQIEDVQHDAVLKVDEAGTVAAAATGISIEPTAVFETSKELVLNHPYLLFLRDHTTGAILFAARVANPTES